MVSTSGCFEQLHEAELVSLTGAVFPFGSSLLAEYTVDSQLLLGKRNLVLRNWTVLFML
jgi:hypothetical protein